MLEYHYERYLFGDTSLSELPDRPRLHILATNLGKGRLWCINRNDLLVQRRRMGEGNQID